MYQTKLIALFTRVSTDLLKTEMVGNGTGYAVSLHHERSLIQDSQLLRLHPRTSGLGRFEIPIQMPDSIQCSKLHRALELL